MSKPLIVLVRPQLAENIGKAARAMLNFGLTELRMVMPRDGWPNEDARPAAAGADSVLDQATIHENLADAVSDCGEVFATTVRRRGISKPVVTPARAAEMIAAAPARSAIVFGPERSGLDSDDVALARVIVTARVNPEFGSLNLAQAVLLLAYEWSRTQGEEAPAGDRMTDEPASQSELEGLIEQLNRALDHTGYFHPPERTPSTKRALRTTLTSPGWSSREIQALRGVISALAKR